MAAIDMLASLEEHMGSIQRNHVSPPKVRENKEEVAHVKEADEAGDEQDSPKSADDDLEMVYNRDRMSLRGPRDFANDIVQGLRHTMTMPPKRIQNLSLVVNFDMENYKEMTKSENMHCRKTFHKKSDLARD